MKRRKAIKNIGLSIGSLLATPMAITLLQSCQKVNITTWKPIFFLEDQSVVLKKIIDLILPHTDDLPGGIGVNVHVFVDKFMGGSFSDDEQKKTKEGMSFIMNTFNLSKEKLVTNIKEKEYHALLGKYLKASEEDKKKYREDTTQKSLLDTLEGIRSLAIWGYKNSEEIGKNVLAYDPIPGVFIGCVSLIESTGGKAWTM